MLKFIKYDKVILTYNTISSFADSIELFKFCDQSTTPELFDKRENKNRVYGVKL